ncbi:hypothetical protein QM588_25720, partial [Rhodococcus sp. IEGM 1354]|nr:hypothetical protein [Rhodococcus sp. IEGM 1354]
IGDRREGQQRLDRRSWPPESNSSRPVVSTGVARRRSPVVVVAGGRSGGVERVSSGDERWG